METAFILIAAGLTGALMAWPRLARAPLWRATLTPLASIIGSGFLIIGPVLNDAFGLWAGAAMAALCAMAWLFGAAIRFNILRLDRLGNGRGRTERAAEALASWALAFAYVVSVAFYLNLLGAFAMRPFGLEAGAAPKLVASGCLLLILCVGWLRGFSALERLEQVAVGLKLAIIAALLAGMAWFMAAQWQVSGLRTGTPAITGWPALALLSGLLVTVQGFETSRYLGAVYDARTRVRSMRLAQGLSTAIYLLYVLMLSLSFPQGDGTTSETAIIGLTAQIAAVLPALLVLGAISAQFSAAVADTSGAGGLVQDLTRGRMSARQGYAVLTAVGLALTWQASVFEIVTYASRAFALYYAVQAGIAAAGALDERSWGRAGLFAGLALCGLGIALFGTPVE